MGDPVETGDDIGEDLFSLRLIISIKTLSLERSIRGENMVYQFQSLGRGEGGHTPTSQDVLGN